MARIPIDDNQDQTLEGEPTDSAPGDGMQQLQMELDDLRSRLARVQADFQNSRRRLETDKEQALQYANASLIKALLPVIDNFERALAVEPETTDAKTILKGMQIVHDQWLNVLRQQQVEEISPKPGTVFDPTKHEALMEQESDEFKPGSIVQVYQKGYALHDRTLRPAQVVVAKGSQ